MKFFKTSVIALTFLTGSLSSFAQTAEEIVSKHLTAIGGESKWKTINTLKLTGAMSAQGMEMPITLTQVHNKAMRMDITIMDMANYQILTKTEGWVYFPIQQQQKPEPMTADQVKDAQDQLDIQDELVDYKAKGSKIEFLGKDDMEGTEVFKVKLVNKEGKEKTLFFDIANYYLIREIDKVKADGKEQEMATNFSNFQKLPEGIVMPMSIETPMGPMTIKAVEVNPKVDENIFKPAN
ncbi:MAG TPA: hypothetical protein PL009_08815 [Flavipsychrobacter sp.]|nr:hypothetical protein [Flavipsychrobacter sp.]